LTWVRILSEPALASNLRFVARKSESLIAHNLAYPEKPAGWLEWKKGLIKEMNEGFQRFGVRELQLTGAS
jgi:hypothetical protein